MNFFKLHHHLVLILIVLTVRIRMESVIDEEDDYDDYDYNSIDNDSNQIKNKNQNLKENLKRSGKVKKLNENLDSRDRYRVDDKDLDYKYEDKYEDRLTDEDYKDYKNDGKHNDNKHDDKLIDNNLNIKLNDNDLLNDAKLDINNLKNLKYENNRNYEIVPNNNYELIEDNDYETDKNQPEDLKQTNLNKINSKDDELITELKDQFKVKHSTKKLKAPKNKKNQVKLIKGVRYPKTIVSKPKYYYPGRNFVHQRQSTNPKKDAKLSKIKMKSNKFVNDEIATLIPLELYKHQVKSRFVSNNEFSRDAQTSKLGLDELEVPHILNGELYCDCGFYLKLKNKKISNLSSKLKKASNEQKQMRQKLIEMAVKENQLQLICRSQSKANLKYINKNDGKPGYLALSNATSQSNPIDLI